MGKKGGVYPLTGITDADLDRAVSGPYAHANLPARRSELHRVSKQIEKHLLEARRVAAHLDGRDRLHIDLQATSSRRWQDGLHDPTNERPQIDLFDIEVHAAGLQAGEIQEVLDETELPRRVIGDGLHGTLAAVGIERALLEQGRPSDDGVERSAKLVRHNRHELILHSIRGFGLGARLLRGFVEPCPIERLRTLLRDRKKERAILVVEIDRRREMKCHGADHRAVHEQRQRRRGDIATIGGERSGPAVPLLPLVEGRYEHRLAARHDIRRAQAGLQCGLRRNRGGVGIQRHETALGKKQHLAGGRAEDVAAVLNDGGGDRPKRGGFGERRRHAMQAARACRKRAISRFAGAQRALDLLPFGQLHVGALPECLSVRARLQRRLELTCAIERLRRAWSQHIDVPQVVLGQEAAAAELELHDGDHTAAHQQRYR